MVWKEGKSMLELCEELFLLYLHEDKCTLLSAASGSLGYSLAAGVLTQLALLGRVKTEERHRLEVVDAASTGNPILDEALGAIQASERSRKIVYWISSLGDKPKRLREPLIERLVAAGVVTQEDQRLSWVIPSPLNPEVKAPEKYLVLTRLRAGVLAGEETSLQDLALLSLVSASDLLELMFLKDERKIARQRIYEMLVGEALKDPVAQVIEEIGSAASSLISED
jgi:Golgi phosphoprotein 3